jgi:hypothetical protein
MGTKPTPALSLKKSREVYQEMARPPEDTPQRRMVFERMREMVALRKRLDVQDAAPASAPRR